jgi:phosphotransferase system HPr (HPr) family protein
MIEKKIKVKIKHGLHARPCSLIVEKRLKCQLDEATATKVATGLTVNLDSIISMLLLVGTEGEDYVFRASGPEEERFIDFVEKLLNSKDAFESKRKNRKDN